MIENVVILFVVLIVEGVSVVVVCVCFVSGDVVVLICIGLGEVVRLTIVFVGGMDVVVSIVLKCGLVDVTTGNTLVSGFLAVDENDGVDSVIVFETEDTVVDAPFDTVVCVRFVLWDVVVLICDAVRLTIVLVGVVDAVVSVVLIEGVNIDALFDVNGDFEDSVEDKLFVDETIRASESMKYTYPSYQLNITR